VVDHRITEIYRQLIDEGVEYVAVTGDLNNDPASEPLARLAEVGFGTSVST
jgi:hypothetical protein